MKSKEKPKPKLPYVIIRGDRSGCFAGFLKEKKDREVTLTECRRLWYWVGSSSLSQLAEEGTSNPSGCKFPCPTESHQILDVIEIIDVTEKAKKSIESVPVWRA